MSTSKFIIFTAWEKPIGTYDPVFNKNTGLTAEGFQTIVLDRDYIMSVESSFCSNTHIPYCVVITKEGGRYDVKETVENFCIKHLHIDLTK
jgi:hypothetical protein